MNFFDDEAGVDGDDFEDDVQPRKRRRPNSRVKVFSDESLEDIQDYDLPSTNIESDGSVMEDDYGDGESNDENQPLEDIIISTPKDTFVTQPDQPWSSPTRIRGARWIKPRQSPVPLPFREVSEPNEPAQYLPRNSVQPQIECDEDEYDDPDILEAFAISPEQNATRHQTSNLNESFESNNDVSPQPRRKLPASFRQTTLFGTQPASNNPAVKTKVHKWPLANRVEPPTHHDIDKEAMKTWVYPTNLGRIRDYQFNIVHKGLFSNLLVALPTGLGKTFIAATVMLNWFNWTKSAQIVFVAPTKPLVTQQVDACFNIAGIPRSQTTLLTGEVQPAIRHEEWQKKRVFFMTPQTLMNDLQSGICDPKRIVLIVVDEAHRATGNYAYVEVVRFLRRFNQSFRVLALTATPGATVESVQKVIDGLEIARVEIRTEDSIDIRDFVHARNIELEIFDNSEELSLCLDLFSKAVQPVLNKLNSQNAYWSKDPASLTLFGLKTARDNWAKSEAGRKANFGLKGMVQSIFKVLMSLAHNIELLKYHGIAPFYHKMKIFESDKSGKYAKQIVEDEHYRKLMNHLKMWVNNPDFVGHPKLAYLKTVVLNHFMDAGQGDGTAGRGPSETRIMVFAHYRDSAEEIARILKRHEPMIRPHVFVGQSGTAGSEGMDQKTQLDIIKKFKAGTYNTIVATSIGEEGLDIGEVDLIVCYDCSKSPIRMLQRMGRTGRKRAGNIVLLLMRGKEERDYYRAKDNYIKMQEMIENGKEFVFHEESSPRIVPKELVPMVDKRVVEIPFENTQPGELMPTKRAGQKLKRPAKKFHMPDGVETGFTFLGGGKKSKVKAKPAAPAFQIDQVLAGLPMLSEVLLNAEAAAVHEQRYMQISGDQPQYIQPVRFDAFSKQLMKASPIGEIKHSNFSRSFTEMINTINQVDKDWTRPTKPGVFTVDDDGEESDHIELAKKHAKGKRGGPPKASKIKNASAEPPTKSHKRARQSSVANDSDQDGYNLSDDFINDEPQGEDDLSSEEEAGKQNTSQPSAPVVNGSQLFYVSQQSIDDMVGLEDELPASQDLLAGGMAAKATAGTTRLAAGRRGATRVVASDDDDE